MFDGVSSSLTAAPSVLVAGGRIAGVRGPGEHCRFLGGEVSGVRGVRAAVRERAERGVDIIKVMASRLTGLIACRQRLYESGAVLVAGSDAGVTPAKPHDVLRFATDDLAAAGMSPAEVLRAMTSRAAQACGLGHRKGRIAVGFDADILAIDGNPLEELAAIRRLRAVYAHGLPVSPAPDVPAGVAVH